MSRFGAGDWATGFAKAVGVFLNGQALPDPDPSGRRIIDDSFLLLFNADHEEIPFVLPGRRWGQRWRPELDSAGLPEAAGEQPAGAKVIVAGRSVRVLRRAS